MTNNTFTYKVPENSLGSSKKKIRITPKASLELRKYAGFRAVINFEPGDGGVFLGNKFWCKSSFKIEMIERQKTEETYTNMRRKHVEASKMRHDHKCKYVFW